MELTYAYAYNRCSRGDHVGGTRSRSQEERQEVQHQEVLGEGEPKANHLPECPDHQLATFVKGNPRSIISLPILLMSPKLLVLINYVIGVVWEHLLHITFSCLEISTMNPI